MKNSFKGYYPPNEDEYGRLWREGIVVLDTNVLLNLYRLPPTTRDEFLTVLELLANRLWIPHQVALEFQRNRLSVISTVRKSTEEAVEAAKGLFSELKQKVDALEIDNHALGVKATPLINDLEKSNEQLLKAIEAVHQSRLDVTGDDCVRDRLDRILAGRVGNGAINQEELDSLVENGDERYTNKTPPGFADADKAKNPNDATFVHDHLIYQRKFGDLILWRQLIRHAKKTKTKAVLLVTADRKEDWWWREQGKTIGPHPELIREIYREGSVELFWMYSAAQFIQHAPTYIAADVSPKSVEDVQQVLVEQNAEQIRRPKRSLDDAYLRWDVPSELRRPNAIAESFAETAVANWLRRTKGPIEFNQRGFPDFIGFEDGERVGYEVLTSGVNWQRRKSLFLNVLRRGYTDIMEGIVTRFVLIIVFSEWSETLFDLELRLFNESQFFHPGLEIVCGIIEDDVFYELRS